MKTNTCAVCGKVYEMHISDGKYIKGVRLKYCSDACRIESKKARQVRIRAVEQDVVAETASPQKRAGDYAKYYLGPLAGLQCFGCPFIGDRCRNEFYPPCRPMSKHHNEYKRVLELQAEFLIR